MRVSDGWPWAASELRLSPLLGDAPPRALEGCLKKTCQARGVGPAWLLDGAIVASGARTLEAVVKNALDLLSGAR